MILLAFSLILGSAFFLFYLVYFLYMRRWCAKGVNWKSNRLNFKVSLIIPTYNEETTLPAKLKNVLEQDYPKKQLELVIIDSASTDQTVKIAEEFIHRNPCMKVNLIQEKERLGKSHALNIAYPRASGDIKIISDSDSILEKTAITNIVCNFSDPTVGAAFGRQILLNPEQNPSTLTEKSYREIWEVIRQGESNLDSTPIFDGELSAYRSNLIEPLPENKSADDSRLANIIRRKGYRAVRDPSAIFYEYAPPNARAKFVQKVRRAQGLIRLFWDFKDCMFKKKYGRYGQLIFPAEFFMHCILPTLWLGILTTFVVGLILYFPILFFSILVLLACLLIVSRTKANNRALKATKTAFYVGMSFLSSQLFMFYALLLWVSGRSLHKWQKVEDIREEWRTRE